MFNIYWWGSLIGRGRARSGPPDRASCVPGAFTRIGTRSDGARRYRSGSGDICADEGNLWT